MEDQDKKEDDIESYIFIGCMFLGMGIGMAFGNTGIGIMIGIGTGFLLSSLYKLKIK